MLRCKKNPLVLSERLFQPIRLRERRRIKVVVAVYILQASLKRRVRLYTSTQPQFGGDSVPRTPINVE